MARPEELAVITTILVFFVASLIVWEAGFLSNLQDPTGHILVLEGTSNRNSTVGYYFYQVNNSTAIRPLIDLKDVKKRGFIEAKREQIRREFSLASEHDGRKPIRNIIISTWRSGSSFLGDLVASHAGTLYLFEPFMFMMAERARTPERISLALKMINSVFNCEFNHVEWLATEWNMTYLNHMLGRIPEIRHVFNDSMYNYNTEISEAKEDDVAFAQELCKLYPIQVIKVVRLRIQDCEELLKDDKYDTRVIYLLRDPRGTMKSRDHNWRWWFDWCNNHTDCSDPAVLCKDLEEDFQAAQKFEKKYPDRFMSLRYEDLSLNVSPMAEKVFHFFRLQFHENVQRFVQEHSSNHDGDEFGSSRNSKAQAFNWIDFYRANATMMGKLEKVQGACAHAMELWGYKHLIFESFIGNSSDVKPQDVLS